MSELDISQFGGELAKRIVNHRRLVHEADEARIDVEAATVLVPAARDDDVRAAVAAKISRSDAPERTHEAIAQAQLDSTKFDAQVARQAALAALDAVVDEARRPRYRDALDKRRHELTQASVAALDALDHLLEQLQQVKAHARWLDSPVTGDTLSRVNPNDLWVRSEGHRKPNGEAGEARDLTRAVRFALEGTDRPPVNPAAEYGLPPGSVLVGPWGSVPPLSSARISRAAAELFEQEAQEAREAQDAIAGG